MDYVIELQEPAFSETVLLRWLNQVEAEIQTEVLLLAVDGIVQYSAEDLKAESNTELIVPAPFSKLYEDYLLWRIALGQGEAERANNLETIYHNSYLAYVRFVCGTIDPGSEKAEQMRYYLTAYQIAVKLGFSGSEEEWIASLKGDDGEIGAGLEITDQVLTEEELPVLTNSVSDIGKAYLVGEGVDALLYIWNGTDWFYKQHLGTVGPPGADGVSPTVEVTKIDGGHRLTITDKTGTKNVDIMDGEMGQTGATGQTGQTGATGEPGKDGVSPTITTAPVSGGYRLTIKDAAGTKSIDLMNGKDGEDGSDGSNGKDGVSPTVSVSVISGGHRLTIKDATGTKTVDLLDGKAGEDGSDGSPGATGEKGADGVGIKNIVFKQNTTAGNVYTINLTDGSSYDFTAPVGPKGADGSGGTGGGGSGEDGVGIQSIQLKSEADTGNTYTIILTDGSTYDFVAPAGPSGKDGSNGEPGKDGTSVTVASVTENTEDGGSNVVKFSDGKTVTIKNGSKGGDGADGKDGSPGAAGKDGTSVTVSSVSESNADGGTNVVTFSDGKKLNIKNGSKGSDGAPGADGSPGAAGKDGTSVTVSNVSESTADGGTNVVTFSDGKKLNVKNGSKGADGSPGAPGEQGERGVTFTPSVDTDGNLSWSNDGGLENPATVNIKGPAAEFDESQIDNIVFITVEDIDEICNPQPDEPDVPPNTFQKVRAFQDGKEYILLFGYNGGYYCLSNEAFNDWTVKAAEVPEVTSTDAQITFTTVPVLFTARASGDGFTLHNGSNNIYGEAASHGTALRVNTEPGIVFTVDTSATGGFDSDEYIAKVDDQAVWLRSSFEAGNTCLKYESANAAVGIDYKDRDATYSTGFLSFVLYEKIS